MPKRILSRSVRAIGGDLQIFVELQKFAVPKNRYKVVTSVGNHTKARNLQVLVLDNCDEKKAKSKYYDVLTPILEFAELTEEVNDVQEN